MGKRVAPSLHDLKTAPRTCRMCATVAREREPCGRRFRVGAAPIACVRWRQSRPRLPLGSFCAGGGLFHKRRVFNSEISRQRYLLTLSNLSYWLCVNLTTPSPSNCCQNNNRVLSKQQQGVVKTTTVAVVKTTTGCCQNNNTFFHSCCQNNNT